MQANASQCKSSLHAVLVACPNLVCPRLTGMLVLRGFSPGDLSWVSSPQLIRVCKYAKRFRFACAFVLPWICLSVIVWLSCSGVGRGQEADRFRATSNKDSSKLTEADVGKAELIQSRISAKESRYHSSSVHEIVNIESGSKKVFRIRLENTTDSEFSFKKISRQCNCMSVMPDEGVVDPGGALDVILQMQAPDRVSASKTTSSIVFESGLPDALSHTVQIVFKYDQLVGFSTNLVEIQVADSDLVEPVRFAVPVMVGEGVPLDDVNVILGKCDTTDLPGFEFEIVSGSLNGSIDLSKSSLTRGGDRIFSSLIIGRNSNDQIDSVPIVIEKTDQVRVFPRFVNFVQANEKSDWIGVAHIRNQDATGVDADMSIWSCSAQIGKVSIPMELKALNPRIGKITMKIPRNFEFQSSGNVVGSRKVDIKISIKSSNGAVGLSVSGVVPVTAKDSSK